MEELYAIDLTKLEGSPMIDEYIQYNMDNKGIAWEDMSTTEYIKYYYDNVEDPLFRSFVSILTGDSTYRDEGVKHGIGGSGLRKRFIKVGLPNYTKSQSGFLTKSCDTCGVTMEYYKSKNRKYCSLECYHIARGIK